MACFLVICISSSFVKYRDALRCHDHLYTVALPSPASWGFIVVIAVINRYRLDLCIYTMLYKFNLYIRNYIPRCVRTVCFDQAIIWYWNTHIFIYQLNRNARALILDSAKPKYTWNTFQCCIFIMVASISLVILRMWKQGIPHLS